MKKISPLRYPGGKSQIYDYIKELIIANNATTYIEPYMGGMGVALRLLFNDDVEKIIRENFTDCIHEKSYSAL